MTRYAFFIDLSVCAGCEACTVACQNLNDLSPDMRYTKISRHVEGAYPDVKSSFVVNQCLHCDAPPCGDVCPTGATYKTAEGPVLVDYDKCIGCRYCMSACPYDARSFDAEGRVVKKCRECIERLQAGLQPACVQTCLTGARVVGDLDDPGSPIHAAIAQPGVFRVDGTGFYFRAPAGIDRSVYPPNFQAAGITFAWQSILQPVGQIVLGGTTAAILVSLAANALKAGKNGGADGEH